MDHRQYIDSNRDRMLGDLRELCRIPSVTGQTEPCREAIAYLRGKFESLGFKVQILETPGAPALFAELPGEGPGSLLSYNHYDVQPPDPLDRWDHPPFEPTVSDGKLWARGVADCKGSLLGRIHAIEALLSERQKIPVTVRFLIEGEEESGSPNLERCVASNWPLIKSDVCVWENAYKDDVGRPAVRLGNKGMLYVELQCTTLKEDMHSRNGPLFQNAAWELNWALSSLKDRDTGKCLIPGFYESVTPLCDEEEAYLRNLDLAPAEMLKRAGGKRFVSGVSASEVALALYSRPTCTICGFSSGYMGVGRKTIIPHAASARIDFRLVDNQDPDKIAGLLRQHLDAQGFGDIAVKVISRSYPSKTPMSHPFVKTCVDTAKRVYGVDPYIEPSAASTGPRYVFTRLGDIPIVGIGAGNPSSNSHAPNENIGVDDYFLAAKHFAAILEKLR